MAMAGLGDPAVIWSRPFHYYIALRKEYLAIMAPPEQANAEDQYEVRQVAPGITVETKKKTDEE